MRTERLVLDTNVITSALLSTSSPPARVLDHAITHCRIVINDSMRREIVATLSAPKFDKYSSREKREAALSRLSPMLEIVPTLQIVRLCRDPHDDVVLEAALNGRADVIVTGDKDLLALHPFRGISVLSPNDYLAHLANESEQNLD